MITVAYCPECDAIVATDCRKPTTHGHPVVGDIECKVFAVPEEPATSYPHRTAAGDLVADATAWFEYLLQYAQKGVV